MEFLDLNNRIARQYGDRLPFVVYSYPDSDMAFCSFQKNDNLYIENALDSNGFVMYPFDDTLNGISIPDSESETVKSQIKYSHLGVGKIEVPEIPEEKTKYVELVKKAVAHINSTEVDKIVLSRKKDVELIGFSIEKLFTDLFSLYPTAFRYVWYHPETGIWCGATPETLVEISKNKFKTMALAGTQPFAEGIIHWRKKEIEEQRYVTEAIIENLSPLVEEIAMGDIRNKRAGTLLHLCTDISGKVKEDKGSLYPVAKALHPTPAVCGTPRPLAHEYIINNEGYSREFYTGFLGSIWDNGASAKLMVNLRCMRIKENTASIFVGGGITRDSQPQEEWRETQNKMQTMLQVLRPMLENFG